MFIHTYAQRLCLDILLPIQSHSHSKAYTRDAYTHTYSHGYTFTYVCVMAANDRIAYWSPPTHSDTHISLTHIYVFLLFYGIKRFIKVEEERRREIEYAGRKKDDEGLGSNWRRKKERKKERKGSEDVGEEGESGEVRTKG